MRDYKFRAWDGEAEMMLDSNELDQSTLGHLKRANEINWHIMQYTGLKDKNGKEIYEGDLVKGQVASEVEGAEPFRFEATKVVWCEECGGFHLMGFFHDSLYRFSNQNAVEVIGNIYENPELTSPKGE
jgi:uncharacterized phage protein (TIGR01671 family)